MSENNEESKYSRRKFLKNSGMVAGGVVGGSLLGGVVTSQFGSESEEAMTDGEGDSGGKGDQLAEARTFFSRKKDFQTLAAMTERIYPEDDQGPGAIELGVPYFIDKQLGGSWGFNAKDYKMGPFNPEESDTHGLQAKLNRGEMFIAGVRRVQEISDEEHGEKFADLDGDKQDKILQKFESGDVDIVGMRADTFFKLLRSTTIEGVYSDPVYGGNRDMQGWKMMGYPGPRMGWSDQIEEKEFVSMEPSNLRDYQGGGLIDG